MAAVLVSSRLINQTTPDVAGEMSESTFPLVYMQRAGIDFNCLHGYAAEMDVSKVRYSITPLTSDREITLRIRSFGASVDSVSYQVETIDGTKVLENTKVIKITEDGDYLNSDLTLQGDMLMNQEYVLKIQVTAGGRVIYYYTHVLLADGLHTEDYLNFAAGFWDKCINKTDLDSIGEAVEPDETTDIENTLAYMDIHDSVSQLTWGDLNPQIYYKPTPRLTEINESTATLTLDYRISSSGDNGVTRLYNVHEYYRLRFTDSRVFLLNFERTTDQIFNPDDSESFSEDGIVLGITRRDIDYIADERQRCVAFVQENELWTYQNQTGTITRVFGFPQSEDMDERDFYKENTIRPLRVNQNGDVWFAVGGYMNRGTHEGENGVAFYYYDAGSSLVTELAFLSTTENTQRVQIDMESCVYLTQDDGAAYCLLNGVLYSIDIQTKEVTAVAEKVANECFAGSKSGQYFAYLSEGSVYGSSTLCVIDFETGETRTISAGEGQKIRPLTFMKETLVYGLAKDSDIQVPHGGNGVFPMYRLVFEDGEGNQLKTYEPAGLYVTEISQSDNLLDLTRVAKSGDEYTEASSDQIVSTDTSADVELGVTTREDDTQQTVVLLRTGSAISPSSVVQATGKMIAGQSTTSIEMPQAQEEEELYYVYASGGMDALCTYPNEAIVKADELFGVVIDHDQDYVWVRGDKDTEYEIDLEDVPSGLITALTGAQSIDAAQLQTAVGEDVLDLSGCTLDEVLYFVAHDRPVVALSSEGVKIIVGYDEYNTYLLTPGEEDWYYYGIQDSTALFEESGNVFYGLMG